MVRKPVIRVLSHQAGKIPLPYNSISNMRQGKTGFASIGVFGDQAPEQLKASHDMGTSLGTSSKGTQGKTPLPKK